jgi:hypothetical protein
MIFGFIPLTITSTIDLVHEAVFFPDEKPNAQTEHRTNQKNNFLGFGLDISLVLLGYCLLNTSIEASNSEEFTSRTSKV